MGGIPVREKDAQYTYTFNGWTPEVVTVTADASYTATYRTDLNSYTVTWVDYNGSQLEVDVNVPYGTTPTYDGITPTRDKDAQYTYTFSGWSPEVGPVSGDTTYTALYSTTINPYKVTWLNYDGTVLEIDELVPYGTTPTYDGETPTKAGEFPYVYTFNGWMLEDGTKVDLSSFTITGETTLIATFTDEDTFTSIADIKANGLNGYIYTFKGILEGLDHSDAYGDCYVTDPETGDSIYIYGGTTTTSALTVNSDGVTGSYSNPRDARTTLADYQNGEFVIGYGIYSAYYSNMYTVFISHETSSYTYSVNISEWDNGTIEASKTEGLVYGEEVTLTVKKFNADDLDPLVRLQTTFESTYLKVNSNGTYTFTASVINEVSVYNRDTTEIPINEIISNGQGGSVYNFSGILEGLDHSDIFGNCYITDPATGTSMRVYGATTTTSALTFTSPTTGTYSNARNATTTLADYQNGELVRGYGVWDDYYRNISVIFISHETSTVTYGVSIDSFTNGSATATPNTAVAYGDTVSVTVTPDAGYSIISVNVINAQGTANLCTEISAGVYTFTATCVNRVVIVCDIPVSGAETTIDLSEDSSAIAAFYPTLTNSYGSASATISPFTFETNRGGLNMASTSTTSGYVDAWAEKYFILAANGSNVSTAYLDISVPSSMSISNVRVNYYNWAPDVESSTILDLQYLNGSEYTSLLSSSISVVGTDYTTLNTLAPAAGVSFSTTTVRIVITTTSTKGNQRIAIPSITLTTL